MRADSAFLKVIEMPRRASPLLALPWDLEEIAGEGASAIVWRARDRASGHAVALKVAKRSDALLREAEILARVVRRWGPALLAVGHVPPGLRELEEGALYVASEWAEGAVLDPSAVVDRER